MDHSISVVMPVRNAMPYLDAAVASILDQTHERLEFVILDDGSTDGSSEALRAWAARDSRIRLFRNEQGLGLSGSANFVVGKASAPIVARMDADDISHPDRLRRELEVLEAHPDAAMVGTLWEGIDSRGRRIRPRDRSRLTKSGDRSLAPFPHGSIMFRREIFERSGGYDSSRDFWEDADLYPRLIRHGRAIVIPESLYLYRVSPSSVRLRSPITDVERAVDAMYRDLVPELAAGARSGGRERLLPRVFVSIGSTRLWDGRSPGVLHRLLRHGDLRWDRESAAVLLWAAWGALHPASLRACLRLRVSLGDRLANRRFPSGALHEWRPDAPSAPAVSSDPARDEEWRPVAEAG